MASRRKKKKKKKILKSLLKTLKRDYGYWIAVIVWVVFVLLLVGYFYLASLKEYLNISKSAAQTPLVSLNRSLKGWVEIDYNNGQKRLFVGDFHQEFSLATVLEMAAKEGKIKLVVKKEVIQSIDGRKGIWKIYRNKKSVGSKLDRLTIKGGDKYVIKKEK